MAKESSIQKHKKLVKTWERLDAERKAIEALPKEQREAALAEFEARRVKNRQFKSRKYNRCSLTGRSRGYFRFFGVSRIVLREMAHRGELPGVKKSSW
jgi:small subunit ribosomal protein S14